MSDDEQKSNMKERDVLFFQSTVDVQNTKGILRSLRYPLMMAGLLTAAYASQILPAGASDSDWCQDQQLLCLSACSPVTTECLDRCGCQFCFCEWQYFGDNQCSESYIENVCFS